MVETYESLDAQVALVTGANRGIGRQIAGELRDLGATVYAGARSQDRAVPEGTEKALLDVTQEGDIEAVVDGIYADQQRLDILVNNAGVRGSRGDLVAEPTQTIDRTLAVNLRGPMLVCKHAVPLLIQDAGGRVVNISSGMAGLDDMDDGSPVYRISKVGLNGLTAYLHAEYNDGGLVANSASPGWVETDMGGENAPRSVAEGADTPVWLSRFKPNAPSGKFWRDREVIDW